MRQRPDQVLLLGACTAIGPLALNMYLPALPLVQQEFGADVAAVQLSVSLALLGFGLGLLLLGPLSDRFGRRRGLLSGIAAYALGGLLATFATQLWLLYLGRFVLSAGAALTFISARSVVADISPREDLPRSVAHVTMINVIAQSMSPLVGNLLIGWGGWRLTQAAAVLMGVVVGIVVWLRQPETLPPAARATARSLLDLTAPVRNLVARAPFRLLMLQVGLLYCAYPAFVATAPHLMVEAFHRPAMEFAWYFAFLPLGYLLGNLFVLQFARRMTPGRLVRWGISIATASCVVSIVLLAAGLWHPLSMFLPAGLLLNFGLGLALPAVSARAVLSAGANVGSAWGLLGFSQQAMAAVSVQLLGFVHATSPYPVLLFCFGTVLIALMLERPGRPEVP